MNVVLMGPPGAGKGTQAEFIKKEYPIPHISTGDMFRDAVSRETELGKEAKKYMDAGKLVPDEVTIGIVEARLAEADCKNGFLLDGFPRTTVQAEALDKVLSSNGRKIDVVINIAVPNDILIRRLSGRVSCKECKVVYNLQSNPPAKEGICDNCGGQLIQRSDDQGKTVAKRLEVYLEQTNPLLAYYSQQNVLQEIDGNRDSKTVFTDIKNCLESLK
ncbi:MAG TPA: adenylate kinase [Syntrophomonas sp.]|nr:adenylate kinase [Syntrophomonas sp.]